MLQSANVCTYTTTPVVPTSTICEFCCFVFRFESNVSRRRHHGRANTTSSSLLLLSRNTTLTTYSYGFATRASSRGRAAGNRPGVCATWYYLAANSWFPANSPDVYTIRVGIEVCVYVRVSIYIDSGWFENREFFCFYSDLFPRKILKHYL